MKLRFFAFILCLLAASSALAQGVTTSFGSGGGGGSAGITSLTTDCTATGTGAVPIYCNGFGDYKAGNFYLPRDVTVAANAGTADATGTIYCVKGSVTKKLTISQIGSAVSTVSSGGNFQWAIYTSAGGYAASLLGSTASGSTTTAGFVSPALASNVQVGPGTTAGKEVVFCVQVDNTTAVFIDTVGGAASYATGSTNGANVISLAAGVAGERCTTGCQGGTPTFGTWPASLATTTWIDVTARNIPAPAFLVNSVP